MKNNLMRFILGCCLASFFFACSGNEEVNVAENSKKECSSKVSAINPNGDSELALLMRKTYLDADSIKQLIVDNEGNISKEFIAELEKAHDAVPTDPKVKTPIFAAFNEMLVNQAKILQESESPEDREEAFNTLVNRCIDCHNSFCPGPIEKIEKLRIR